MTRSRPLEKDKILELIRALATRDGGCPPGADRFCTETGFKYGDWYGVLWARWSDAVREAGFTPNAMRMGFDEAFMLKHFADLVREMGRVPTGPEVDIRRGGDSGLPTSPTYRKRFGGKLGTIAHVQKYCEAQPDYADVAAICRAALESAIAAPPAPTPRPEREDGTVYLVHSGRFHKIGRTNCIGRRTRELTLQSPEKLLLLHAISTDDPVGVEMYWHRRFAAQRRHGEFFALNGEDVEAFKRWQKI